MEHIQGRIKLYDGLETKELYDTVFPVYEYAFPVKEMLRGKFLGLRPRLSDSEFSQMVTASGFVSKENSDFKKNFSKKFPEYQFDQEEYYTAADGLTLYYDILNDSLIFLFSFGEVQPARYVLYSEGVWKIESSYRFSGNMGEPDTISGYILRDGVDPRTGQLHLKNLQQLHDTLIVKGYTRFYIAAEGIGGPDHYNADILDFVNGTWVVRPPEQGKEQIPLFTSPDKDEAIVFFYKHILSNTHRHQVAVSYPILRPSQPKKAEPKIAELEFGTTEKQKEPISGASSVAFDDKHLPELSHNLASFTKQLQQLFKMTAACGIIGVVLKLLFGADGPGGLFYLFFAFLLIWCLVFPWRQDNSKPALTVTSEGLFINQQFLRNAFVPWENIAMAELRGFSDKPSIVLTFATVKTLLKNQFFIFRSLVKARLKPIPTMVISGFETEGDLKRAYAAMKHYLPKEKTIEAIAYDHKENHPSVKKESAYIRLEDNRSKEYYRKILEQALQQAEQEYRQAPHSALNESFFNQLTDIKKTVIEQGVVYTEAEADKRYPLGVMAIRNFDGDYDWDYPKKLVDISSGVSQYQQMPEKPDYRLKYEDQCNEIDSAFAGFFKQHDFTVKSKVPGSFEMVYENACSELIFDFDSFGSRFGWIAPATVIYKHKASGRRYSVKELIRQLRKADYEILFKEYYDQKRLGYYETQKEVIANYLNDIIGDTGFLWEKSFHYTKW
jgi:hypothetical protein